MTKRFLITTAEESTWLLDRPVLFLGEWCRLYKRRDFWGKLDAEVSPYHWDDRELYYKDYSYLQKVYEEALKCSSDALNTYHGTNYSVRYWRIIIGPWLHRFVNILYDRWAAVHKASNDYLIDGTIILKQDINKLIPSDLEEFIFLMWEDKWNNYIIGEIIKKHTDIKWEEKKIELKLRQEDERKFNAKKITFIKFLFYKFNIYFEKFTYNSELFIAQSGLPVLKELLFQIYLGQFPKLRISPKLKKLNPDYLKRSRFNISIESNDVFYKFISSMISLQIPVLYLEGYSQLESQVDKLPWPKKPKAIFTSNAYEADEAFKLWAASKVEFGTPLIIGQHGGFYGIGKWISGEDHQIAISDRFLNWGWSDIRESVFSLFPFTDVGKKKIKWNNKGDLILISVPIARYSQKSDSWPNAANQSNQYINNQISFIGKLPRPIRIRSCVRIRADFDKFSKTFFMDRLKDVYPEVRIDPTTTSIDSAMSNCRILITGYNGTSHIYSLSQNIPTIIFWDPNYFELRDSAKPFFEILKQVGIFHESSESASSKVKDVWDDVDGWWYQEDIQEARRNFCAEFAHMPKAPFKVLKDRLNIQI